MEVGVLNEVLSDAESPSRHADVEHGGVDRVFVEHLECLERVRRGEDLMSPHFEDSRQSEHDERLIVSQEDPKSVGGLCFVHLWTKMARAFHVGRGRP